MKRILLFTLVAGISLAQTASIYELSGDDAAEGLKLHDAMVKADAAYAAWDAKVSKKYGKPTNVYDSDGPIHEELDYSPDFKHAVPKDTRRTPLQIGPACIPGAYCGTMTLPASTYPVGSRGSLLGTAW